MTAVQTAPPPVRAGEPVPPARPRWSRPAFAAVLGLAALLYTWGLSANGYANTYYSAAVLSATKSWSAFFYGALDAGGFITVDKPPLALWVQALSARVFGFSSWSLLLPQALAALAAVAVVHHVARRAFGPLAGLLAALALALTPITVALARHNNPDTLLVLLLTLAAWAVSSAVRTGRFLPLLGAGIAIGLAFNTKMLQAYLLVPAAALAWLGWAPGRPWTRLAKLGAAGTAMVAVSLAWLWAVDGTDPATRPYVGGSTDNTVWELLFGYNGLGRLLGQDRVGSPGLTAGGGGAGNASGWDRLLTGEVGGQVAWLFPLALCGLVAAWALRERRAELVLWGGWLVTTAVVFSAAEGIWHTYYTVALGPPLAVLVGAGVVAMARLHRRRSPWGWLLPVALAMTGFWGATLLGRTPDHLPWLPFAVVAASLAAAVVLAVPLLGGGHRASASALATALTAVLAGPAAYAVTPLAAGTSVTFPIAQPPIAQPPIAQPPIAQPTPARTPASPAPPKDVTDYAAAHYRDERWGLAVVGALVAAPVILDTGLPVLAVGGFNGNDPAPTTTALRDHVRTGSLRFVWTTGASTARRFTRPGQQAGTGTAVVDEALAWVVATCVPVPGVGGEAQERLYDCASR